MQRFQPCAALSRRCSPTLPIPPTMTTCGVDTHRASRRVRGRRWRLPGSAGRGWNPRRRRRARGRYDAHRRSGPGRGRRARQAAPTRLGRPDRRADPLGRSAVIPDAGHCPQIERPAAVNELVLDLTDSGARAQPGQPVPAGRQRVMVSDHRAASIWRGQGRHRHRRRVGDRPATAEKFLDEGARVLIADIERDLGGRPGHHARRRRAVPARRRRRRRAGQRLGRDRGQRVRGAGYHGQQRWHLRARCTRVSSTTISPTFTG